MGPLVITASLFLLMWVLFILPQQRRVRAHQALVARLEVGDDVMTSSGMFGTITAIEADAVSIEVADGVVIRFARGAVATRVGDEPPPEEPPAAEAAEVAPADEPAGDEPAGQDALAGEPTDEAVGPEPAEPEAVAPATDDSKGRG